MLSLTMQLQLFVSSLVTYIFRKYHLLLSLSLSLIFQSLCSLSTHQPSNPRLGTCNKYSNHFRLTLSLYHSYISILSFHYILYQNFLFFFSKKKKKKRFFPFFLFVSERNYNTSCIWVFFFYVDIFKLFLYQILILYNLNFLMATLKNILRAATVIYKL